MSSSRRILLEIAVESIQDAVDAVEAGADRLEICSALDCGGLTPSVGMLSRIRRNVDVQLMAMIRPRNGGFCYNDREFDAMRADVQALCDPNVGADGIVTGFLDESGGIDKVLCREIVRVCTVQHIVFHRAIDLTPDPVEALETLIEIGFTRVLTAGGQAAASHPDAMRQIAAMTAVASGRIEIMPGSGIRADNVRAILDQTHCGSVHAGCRERRRDMQLSGRLAATLAAINGHSAESYSATATAQVAALRAAISAG